MLRQAIHMVIIPSQCFSFGLLFFGIWQCILLVVTTLLVDPHDIPLSPYCAMIKQITSTHLPNYIFFSSSCFRDFMFNNMCIVRLFVEQEIGVQYVMMCVFTFHASNVGVVVSLPGTKLRRCLTLSSVACSEPITIPRISRGGCLGSLISTPRISLT